MSWLRRLVIDLSHGMPKIDPRPVHVAFLVIKVAVGQVFQRVLGLSRQNLSTTALKSHFIYHRHYVILTGSLNRKPQPFNKPNQKTTSLVFSNGIEVLSCNLCSVYAYYMV